MSKPTIDQYKGCLLGLAVGDAVGAPVEKSSFDELQAYRENHLQPRDFEGAGRTAFEDLEFGHVTDDTQLAVELVRAIIKGDGIFSPLHFSEGLVDLFESGNIIGYGGSTKKAVDALAEGTVWHESGVESSGNGAAMRVAPLGLLHEDLDILFADVMLQGIITHNSDESNLASMIIAAAVSLGARRDKVDHTLGHEIADFIEGYDEELAGHIRVVSGYANRVMRWVPHSGCIRYVLDLQGETTWEGFSPYCVTTALWALYSFLYTPDSYWQTITTALYHPGDVDTIAAMAGAISGATNGLEAIPSELVALVHDSKQNLRADELEALAAEMHELVE